MIRLLNNPDFLISYDRNYMVFQGKNENNSEHSYVFYNTLQHIAARLNEIEFSLLELLYKYEDIEYISSRIDITRRNEIKNVLLELTKSNILSTVEDAESLGLSRFHNELIVPETYYMHLTDNCNLKCTYCYNKEHRKNRKDLPLEKWEIIIDKIIPYAKSIVLTGGECFLYKDIGRVIEYINVKNSNIAIQCISNGMHNYEEISKKCNFNLISSIMFSCDSITAEKERLGFNPQKFTSGIKFIKEHFPNVDINISTTMLADNDGDISNIRDFCRMNCIEMGCVTLAPNILSDIEKMPKANDPLKNICFTQETTHKQLNSKKYRCGAASFTCSIDCNADIYPCQSLHYKEFLMGNILNEEILDLKYIKDKMWCLPSVNEIENCAKCEVKYLCGGGCLAVSYPTNNFSIKRNRLICPYNYNIAVDRLVHFKATKTLKK